jgi:BirA family transcriptional regulator, biotin operon repressor / biotin---[acetyl-CoA-carboxylase] ligase
VDLALRCRASSLDRHRRVVLVRSARDRALDVKFDLQSYASVPSTMDLAMEAVLSGAPEGLVIAAEEQTAGRGRRGRAWNSPAGAGLYFSVVLRPTATVGAAGAVSLITLCAGVGVREGLMRTCGLATELKWPNDVMCGPRKLAGILAEGHGLGTANQAIILGVGVNVLCKTFPPDVAVRATSIEHELGHAIDRTVLLSGILGSLSAWYERLQSDDADGILRAWREAAPSAVGSRVAWANGERQGVTTGVDRSGALLVTSTAGVERIVAGELRWLEPETA